MTNRKLCFALIGNEYQARKSTVTQRILDYLNAREAKVCIDRTYYDFLRQNLHADIVCSGVFDDYDFEADYVISLGGDGTFLKAANRVGCLLYTSPSPRDS